MDALISLGIACYLLWAWVSTGPSTSILWKLVRPIDGVMWWIGLTHGWAMYSPEPLQSSRWVRAYVTYADGTQAMWEAPRVCELGRWQAFLRMRHSRHQDALCNTRHPSLRPAFCEYLSRRLSLPGRAVVIVRLVCVEQRVPPPSLTGVSLPIRESRLYTWDAAGASGVRMQLAAAGR